MLNRILRTALRSTLSVCVPGIVAICAGCSSHQSSLTMVSLDEKRDFAQSFTEAYITRQDTGDTDIMLLAEAQPAPDLDPHKPITPDAAMCGPRQVVHIRVYWKPMMGTHADHPASTNASIHWYLIGDPTAQAGVLEYSGSGLVEVDQSDDEAKVNIRTAWMKAVQQRGCLADRIGPSTLSGKIRAKVDAAQVKSLLAELKAETGPVIEARATAASAQPKRLMVGP